jgi:glycosyltransferase involved in cell wall biosynthesis
MKVGFFSASFEHNEVVESIFRSTNTRLILQHNVHNNSSGHARNISDNLVDKSRSMQLNDINIVDAHDLVAAYLSNIPYILDLTHHDGSDPLSPMYWKRVYSVQADVAPLLESLTVNAVNSAKFVIASCPNTYSASLLDSVLEFDPSKVKFIEPLLPNDENFSLKKKAARQEARKRLLNVFSGSLADDARSVIICIVDLDNNSNISAQIVASILSQVREASLTPKLIIPNSSRSAQYFHNAILSKLITANNIRLFDFSDLNSSVTVFLASDYVIRMDPFGRPSFRDWLALALGSMVFIPRSGFNWRKSTFYTRLSKYVPEYLHSHREQFFSFNPGDRTSLELVHVADFQRRKDIADQNLSWLSESNLLTYGASHYISIIESLAFCQPQRPIVTGVYSERRSKPRLAIIYDVDGWIFHKHAVFLSNALGERFDISIFRREAPFLEADFDLIYPLEWDLVPQSMISRPSKWVTGIRSHISWDRYPFDIFCDYLRKNFSFVHVVSNRLLRIFEHQHFRIELLSHGYRDDIYVPKLPVADELSGSHSAAGDLLGRPSIDRPIRVGWAGNPQSKAKGFTELIKPLAKIPWIDLRVARFGGGALTSEQMRVFYESIDVYLCVSSSEGSNNSLMEASACGCAVVTTDVGNVNEYLVPNESALFIDRNLDSVLAAISRIRDHPDLIRSLGLRAADAVKPFSWTVQVRRHATFFEQALLWALDPNVAPSKLRIT